MWETDGLLDLRSAQQKITYVCYCKASQLYISGSAMDHRGKHITATCLNSCNFTALHVLILLATDEGSSQFSANKLLCSVRRDHYRNPKLAKMSRLWSCPGLVDASTIIVAMFKASVNVAEQSERLLSAGDPGYILRLCLQYKIGKLHP